MRALICGVSGQDGSYLADLLLRKGYESFSARRAMFKLARSPICFNLEFPARSSWSRWLPMIFAVCCRYCAKFSRMRSTIYPARAPSDCHLVNPLKPWTV